MQSYWIWSYGDWEIFHTNLVNSRRQEFGADYPCFWKMSDIVHNIRFYAEKEAVQDGYGELTVNGLGHILVDGLRYPANTRFPIEKGWHKFEICAVNTRGLPAAFLQSDVCPTGHSWYTIDGEENPCPVGWNTAYSHSTDNPEVFPFAYTRKEPVSRKSVNGGVLFDFGTELFGFLNIENVKPMESLHISYGESREEALDIGHALLFEEVTGKAAYQLRQRAFRYVFVTGSQTVTAWADYEYLPLAYKGSFRCDREAVNEIWQKCAYTLHLNTREVLLDGIKRDRWLWSGDAYQCYNVCNYLFFDKEIVRRTILGLRGRGAVEEHINTITDYSLYWIISLWDYYHSFGDLEFIRFIYPRAVSLMEFVKTREDDSGLLVKKFGDWIFIDWTDMDKTDPVCAEQMLYLQANKVMAKLADLLNCNGEAYSQKAEALYEAVNRLYWDDEKGGYIDSFCSGRRNITRHANIFATAYDIATREQRESIVQNVLLNEAITKITTPYFEGYELDVMGKVGNLPYIENMLLSYWQGILEQGATTIWEEYDPKQSGTEHYAMYGNRYGKSHAHAWGSSPIYLLGRYYLGVYPTAPGYETFTVEPKLGGFAFVEGVVPIVNGEVSVYLSGDKLEVTATRPGGTLLWNGKHIPLEENKAFTWKRG